MSVDMLQPEISRVNGVALNAAGETLTSEELRQRACSELLRQAAIARGLLDAADAPASDGILSEAATHAIEALLEQTVTILDPSEDECRRHHAAHRSFYTTGEQINVRHILFAVTPGVDVAALRSRAEATLLDVRCHDGSILEDRFAKAANTQSNCPSGAEGGNLGWLKQADCAPEFGKGLFGHADVGVLPHLVHSRFGFHVIEVLERNPGVAQPFETVRGAVAMALRQKAYVTTLRQHLRQLAEQAEIVGIDIEAVNTSLDL